MKPEAISNQPELPTIVAGTITSIVYHNQDNGWIVFRVESEEGVTYTVTGNTIDLHIGDVVKVTGNWITHKKFGPQLSLDHVTTLLPTTIAGIKKYLAHSPIKGIGPVIASKIVDKFGVDTLTVLNDYPEKLHDVEGLGETRIQALIKGWKEYSKDREIYVELYSYGIGPITSRKIIAKYKEKTLLILEENPYQIAEKIDGIGFKIADKIAQNMGLDQESTFRIRAGLFFTLKSAWAEGHTFLPEDVLFQRAIDLLNISRSLVENTYESILDDTVDRIFCEEDGCVYLTWAREVERSVALKLSILAREDYNDLVYTFSDIKSDLTLDPDQVNAVEKAFDCGVSIITGGPGTGKTTIIKQICQIALKNNINFGLCAPTGRASKRLSEATKFPASTIHRFLEYKPDPETWVRNSENPVNEQLVIVDEMSMVGSVLMKHLLDAIDYHNTRLILVGDKDQLPPVEAGAVLRESIDSGYIPVTTLQTIHRQAQRSMIIRNAHRINWGKLPLREIEDTDKDFYMIGAEEPSECIEALKNLILDKLPKIVSFNSVEDMLSRVQILSPMKKGSLGIDNLNKLLQRLINLNSVAPGQPYVEKGGRKFYIGDKVMQIKNNYENFVFNGEQGFVRSIDPDDRTLTVEFDDNRTMEYNFDTLSELYHSYASTIHKAQGSEFDVVIGIIHTQQYIMLKRNLLYTAVTRGKKLVILIGIPQALAIAVKNDSERKRYSRLSQLIHEL